jgi:hypothetical protein
MTTERPIVACSIEDVAFLGGVYGFGLGEYLGALAEFCVGCNIDLGLPWFRAAYSSAAACGACEMVAMGQIHYRTGFRNRGGYGRTRPSAKSNRLDLQLLGQLFPLGHVVLQLGAMAG